MSVPFDLLDGEQIRCVHFDSSFDGLGIYFLTFVVAPTCTCCVVLGDYVTLGFEMDTMTRKKNPHRCRGANNVSKEAKSTTTLSIAERAA